MWIKEIEELQTVKIKFPIMSDPTCTILKMVRSFDDNTVTISYNFFLSSLAVRETMFR